MKSKSTDKNPLCRYIGISNRSWI